MDRCALEFIARRWWRRAEIWVIALVLIAGGAVLGWRSAYWAMTSAQANQVTQIREAYGTAMAERDKRLDELTSKAESAATKASTTANQAANKADEALNRVAPSRINYCTGLIKTIESTLRPVSGSTDSQRSKYPVPINWLITAAVACLVFGVRA